MTRFLDGPAAKCKMMRLGRAPYFLRVVQNKATKVWDACDQLEDVPRPDEEIFVYVQASDPIRAFIRPGGLVILCDYRLHDSQPPDDVARDNAKWKDWTWAEGARLGLTVAPPRPKPGETPSE